LTTPSTNRTRRWTLILLIVLLTVLMFIKDFAVELLAPSFQTFATNHPKLV
jgi:hypothetical protein